MDGIDPIVFADTTWLVVDAIRDGFTIQGLAVIVDNEVPDDATRYVVVRRQGGPRLDQFRDAAQIRVESIAPTKTEAHDNAQVARAYIQAMRGSVRHGTAIYRIDELAGPAELPDPISQLPRYVFTEVVHTRGRALTAP